MAIEPEVINDAEQITPQWLTARLRQNGHLAAGAVDSVRLGESFESTAAFFTRLQVGYAAAAEPTPPGRLIFKSYRRDWYGGGVAEAVFFREIAAQTPDAPVFRCYDTASDGEARQCYFIFADVSATHSEQPPDDFTVDLYRQIIDELLKFHVRWWGDPRIAQRDFTRGRGGPLRMVDAATPEITRAYCRDWRDELLPRLAEAQPDDFSPEARDFALRAIDGWERLYIARIEDGAALTFLHGDCHCHNIFYPRAPAAHGLYLADWETYKRGIGPYDLCDLVSFEAADRRREIERDLLRYYYDGLIKGGVQDYSWEDCLYDYRLAAIATLFPAIAWQSPAAFAMRRARFDDWDCMELWG